MSQTNASPSPDAEPVHVLVTRYSYREYECFPNDGFRHEIIDGEHYLSPAPATKQQKVSRKIHFQLYTQIEQRKLVTNIPLTRVPRLSLRMACLPIPDDSRISKN